MNHSPSHIQSQLLRTLIATWIFIEGDEDFLDHIGQATSKDTGKSLHQTAREIIASANAEGIPTTSREEELAAALREAIAYIDAGFPPDSQHDQDSETVSIQTDDGTEATFHYAKAKALIS